MPFISRLDFKNRVHNLPVMRIMPAEHKALIILKIKTGFDMNFIKKEAMNGFKGLHKPLMLLNQSPPDKRCASVI
jgi:hypothetical protein